MQLICHWTHTGAGQTLTKFGTAHAHTGIRSASSCAYAGKAHCALAPRQQDVTLATNTQAITALVVSPTAALDSEETYAATACITASCLWRIQQAVQLLNTSLNSGDGSRTIRAQSPA